MVLGTATGLIEKPEIAARKVAGDIFLRLFQMTVVVLSKAA